MSSSEDPGGGLSAVVADMEREALENAARAALGSNSEYLDSGQLEAFTGTKASTWRYWASVGEGPASMKIGRRRVWRKSAVLAWLAAQEAK